MRSLLTAAALAAFAAAGALPAAANTLTPPIQQTSQLQAAAVPPWMRDDGSSSDHPIPMPGDRSGEALNSQYRDGITVMVPPGAAAPPGFAPVPPPRY